MLKHHAHPALIRRQADLLLMIKQGAPVEADKAAIRLQQPGQHMHEGGFATARGAEDPALFVVQGKGGMTGDAGEVLGHIYFEKHGLPPCQGAVGCLADEQHGKGEQDGDQAEGQSHAVAARRAGVLVDSQGDGLSDTGDISCQHDGGAELTQAAGKHQGHSGKYGPAAQGHSDSEQGIPPFRAQGSGGLDVLAVNALHADADGADQQGETYHCRGDHRPTQGEDDTDIKEAEKFAQPAVPTKEQEEEITGHHWRQDQGQVNHTLQQGLAAHITQGQEIGHGKAGRQGNDRRGDGHLHGEFNSLDVVGG